MILSCAKQPYPVRSPDSHLINNSAKLRNYPTYPHRCTVAVRPLPGGDSISIVNALLLAVVERWTLLPLVSHVTCRRRRYWLFATRRRRRVCWDWVSGGWNGASANVDRCRLVVRAALCAASAACVCDPVCGPRHGP